MGSQLTQHALVRWATWLTSAMLALPVMPGGPCTCLAGQRDLAAARCADHGGPGANACCCCGRHSQAADSRHEGTGGAACHCSHAPAPTAPAVPNSQAQSSADQLLIAQATVSTALPPNARPDDLAAALAHDHALATGSALDRCVLLSRLIL